MPLSRTDGDRQAVLTAKPSRITIFLIVMAAGAVLVGPSEGGPAQTGRLILTTTTSLADSGLLRVLLPAFTRTHGIRVDVISSRFRLTGGGILSWQEELQAPGRNCSHESRNVSDPCRPSGTRGR